jgi:hypothetical protein
VVVPGAAVPAVRTNRIVYVDGLPAGSPGGPDAQQLVERVLEHVGG